MACGTRQWESEKAAVWLCTLKNTEREVQAERERVEGGRGKQEEGRRNREGGKARGSERGKAGKERESEKEPPLS